MNSPGIRRDSDANIDPFQPDRVNGLVINGGTLMCVVFHARRRHSPTWSERALKSAWKSIAPFSRASVPRDMLMRLFQGCS